MVELLEGCGLYEETSGPVVMARVRAIELLGADAVTKKRGKPNMSANDMKIVARRKNLRAFAVEIGAVPQSDSYRVPSEKLVPAIEAVTDDDGNQRYSNVAQMSDEEIIGIIAQLQKGGKDSAPATKRAKKDPAPEDAPAAEAKPKPTRKRRTRKPKAEPETETAAAEEEAPSKEPASKPARKPRAASKRRRSAATAEAPAAAVSSKDLELLNSMVKDIGLMVEKQGKQIADLTDTVSTEDGSLLDKVNSIEQFLCWMYNTEYNEGNEISSLTEVTWT